MFNKLRARFYYWLKNADAGQYCESPTVKKKKHKFLATSINTAMNEDLSIDSRGIHFKVIPGNGGIVIETHYYDDHADRDLTHLYIIGEDEELHEALAKIITLEALRR